MDIVFMGTPDFAIPPLQALIDSRHRVLCVICQTDKVKGRGKKLTSPPTKILAQKHGIEVSQPAKIRNNTDFIDHIKMLDPDIICVVAYGKILPIQILEIPRLGNVNVHASILPKYRGAAPINWAIINGETTTGVTTMLMDKGMDTGDILLIKTIEIKDDDSSKEISEQLSKLGADLLLETLEKIELGTINPIKQDDSDASYAPMIKKQDGLIIWEKSANEIHNLIRGTQPWPGAFTTFNSKLLKIFKSEINSLNGTPGEIIDIGKELLIVGTGKNSLKINELQIEGGKKLYIGDFLRGNKLELGMKFGKQQN